MPKGGLRNPKGGRPLGSKNRIPKPKEAQQRLTEIVAELENGEYLYTTADKKYVGSAMELLQSVYRAESLPVKIRLYAATKAVDIEPRAIPQQEIDAQADQYAERLIAEVAAHRREHIREWDCLLYTSPSPRDRG